ncbi:Aliphatic nitrilase [Delftia tsuruhatensis]|uniref:carbon-nitrogen hydrolase family protein n=1 Tax=Delftia tsuruhatensis TaxID=180282 RepID=UPI001E79BD9D|nr:carbon-nitrogen hydrolase family protein [Delftia tsuruhatensis]CAB5686315.1 Aliphatic nitrilase [Delftia tsuruhatensis]CAC9690387.1 Aliphatic nitrilase [Delftia tsuruhatensis]
MTATDERRRPLRVAAVQAAPVFMDRQASLGKALHLIEQAAAAGAQLVAFGEAWLPGYPWWIWLDSPAAGMPWAVRLHAQALVREGTEMAQLSAAARKHAIVVVMGHVERFGASLYLAQSIIDVDGTVQHRRKLKPSNHERSLFGEGDGSDLRVKETAAGRVGALCCWEHLMPLSRHALAMQHAQIHVAAWPALSMGRDWRYTIGPAMTAAINQTLAVESACFVIAPTAVLDQDLIAALCDTPEKRRLMGVEGRSAAGGAAMVYGPDGAPMAPPLPEDQEGLVLADLDFSALTLAKRVLDTTGHSARPDVLRLHVDYRAQPSVVYTEAPPSSSHGSEP